MAVVARVKIEEAKAPDPTLSPLEEHPEKYPPCRVRQVYRKLGVDAEGKDMWGWAKL